MPDPAKVAARRTDAYVASGWTPTEVDAATAAIAPRKFEPVCSICGLPTVWIPTLRFLTHDSPFVNDHFAKD